VQDISCDKEEKVRESRRSRGAERMSEEREKEEARVDEE